MHSKSSVWITFIPVFWKNGHGQEIKDTAERIVNTSINSKVEKGKNSTYIYKEKKTQPNQEYVRPMNLIKSSMLLRIIICSCKIQRQNRKQMIIITEDIT